MSKDCNVKKYKAVVNNDNLVGIDEMLFEVNAPAGTPINSRKLEFSFGGSDNVTVEVIGDGYITNDNGDNLGKTIVIAPYPATTIKFSTGTYKIKVNNKYNLQIVQGGTNSKISLDYKYLHYSLINTCYSIVLTGEVKFNRIPILFDSAAGGDYYGNFDSLKDFDAKGVTALACKYLTGNASSLKNINSSQYICTFNASGTVESLVEARAARNVAGAVKLDLMSSTLNGKKAPQMKMTYTATGNCTIQYEGTSSDTIATYESGTWTYYGNYQ